MSEPSKRQKAEYCAAVLIQLATDHEKSNGLQYPIDELNDMLQHRYNMVPSEEDIQVAMEILEGLELGEKVEAGHARPYFFVPRGNFHRNSKDGMVAATLSFRLDGNFPILTAYRKLGETWLSEAVSKAYQSQYTEKLKHHDLQMKEIMEAMRSTDVPAADRVVTIDHNSDEVIGIDEKLSELEQSLEKSNEVGAVLGDNRVAAITEVGILRKFLKSTELRVSIFLEVSKKSLSWITEKAGSAVVGDLAKSALKQIMNWLS